MFYDGEAGGVKTRLFASPRNAKVCLEQDYNNVIEYLKKRCEESKECIEEGMEEYAMNMSDFGYVVSDDCMHRYIGCPVGEVFNGTITPIQTEDY